MLEEPGVIVMPGVYDAFTARIAEKVGFEIITHSGGSTSASLIGQPDVGLVSFREMCDRVAEIARSVEIPLFADADTGYGNPINVYRTVKEYIWAGAAGLFIEDQQWPKRCGHLSGKQIIPVDELIGKVKAALDARNEEDPDFVLCVRTDAIGAEGFEEALKRARICKDLGVDFFLIEPYESIEQMRQAAKEVDLPLALAVVEGGKTPLVSVSEAEEIGFKLVAFPGTAQFACAKAVHDVFQLLKQNGSPQSYLDKVIGLFDYFDEFLDLPRIWEMEQKYK
jgi:methylisocitrate lyase